MDKRAYYLELPDKDFALLLMDDGEKQEILTTSVGWPEVWMDLLREKGFEPLSFQRSWRSATDPDGTLKHYSVWHRTDGQALQAGYLLGIGPFGHNREAGKEADYPPTP